MTDPTAPEEQLRAAYRERAHLTALLAAIYPSTLAYTDPDEPDWPVLYVNLPTGQASWHIAPDDLGLFGHVCRDDSVRWDGHTTDEKYARIQQLAEARTAEHGQLAALQSWLAAETLKIRHRLPHMRVPEVWRSMDGMAHGLDYAARIIDRYAATRKLPVTGGKACDCADPETQHRAAGVDRVPSRMVDPADSCRGPGALPYRCYCDCQGCEAGDCAAHQTLRQRTDHAEAALDVRDTELAQLRAQVAEVRRFCELTADASVRVDAAQQARDTLAILNRPHTLDAGR